MGCPGGPTRHHRSMLCRHQNTMPAMMHCTLPGVGTVDVELSDSTVMIPLSQVQRHHLDRSHVFGFALRIEHIVDACPVRTRGQDITWNSIREVLITDLSPVRAAQVLAGVLFPESLSKTAPFGTERVVPCDVIRTCYFKSGHSSAGSQELAEGRHSVPASAKPSDGHNPAPSQYSGTSHPPTSVQAHGRYRLNFVHTVPSIPLQ